MNTNKLYDYIQQDFPGLSFGGILKKYIGSRGLQAVILFRISSYFYNKGNVHIADLIRNKCIKKTGADIGPSAKIGKGLSIGHPVGVVITGNAEIGDNCFLLSGVVIGSKSNTAGGGYVTIGNNVYIGTGAKIVGKKILIGDNVTIGANAVVLNDIPAGSTCVGIPARVIRLTEK